MKKQLSLIYYDIRNSNRLRKTSNCLLDYGQRTQYSLFEAQLNSQEFAALKERLDTIIDSEDDLQMHRLCRACESRIVRLGLQSEIEEDEFIVI